MARRRLFPTGIRKLNDDTYQAYLTHAGKFYSQTFPLQTPLSTMKEWRSRKRAELKYGTAAALGRTFADDAADYLAMVAGMPSYADRRYHIVQWVQAFGPRVRASISAADVRRQLEVWRVAGRDDGKGLSVASLNRRRTALMHLFTTLDGKSQPNIVKDVAKYHEGASHQIRARPMLEIARAIRQTRAGSKARIILRLFRWTGWPNKLAKSIQKHDHDPIRMVVRLPARRKGKGMKSIDVPILPQASRILSHLFRRFGAIAFSDGSIRIAFQTGCKKAGVPIARAYDIRHSFGTWAATRVRDDRALSELLRTDQIRRYTEAAAAERLAKAVQDLQVREGKRGQRRVTHEPERQAKTRTKGHDKPQKYAVH